MEILVILLLILLNGLFAMSEIALISARRSNLEMQARQGSAGARQALKLAKDPDRFLSTVQIGITLIGILTGIYSGDTLAAKFGGELAFRCARRPSRRRSLSSSRSPTSRSSSANWFPNASA